ncbi:MAG: ABC transporter, partial [Rhodocyclales bacterium]|nr:ABC transporter [Rhodocyclales bacterium]
MPTDIFPRSLPAGSRHAELAKHLTPDENVLAWLEVDLDAQLHFRQGLLVVTPGRLLERVADSGEWRSWEYRPGLSLRHFDHAGVGTLELCDSERRLASWRYTLGQNIAALQVLDHFERQTESRLSGQPPRPLLENVCPNCKAVMEPGQEECPICTRETQTPPSTWTLFRLWRFARPYRGQLFAGLMLTLATTAASMIPPYLTMPLMDDILIPYQNGKPIDTDLVGLYLGGLLGASLLAWLMGWIRTYILALVSERIGADLRTATYEHLLRLSLEYFGGKRTGDLIARIGSESDRICVFLSLHLLDFANDVLMILMTSAILFAINPWLALVTLLPLPFIAWMIHVVRDRLRTGFEKIDRVWSEVTNVLADTIPGIRVVKAFAQEERETTRFREANHHNLVVNERINRTWSLFSPTVSLLTDIGLLVVWGFGIWQVSHNDITVGVLSAFLAYIG